VGVVEAEPMPSFRGAGADANLRPEVAKMEPRGRKLVLASVSIAACDNK
jgi:hypothetical protein